MNALTSTLDRQSSILDQSSRDRLGEAVAGNSNLRRYIQIFLRRRWVFAGSLAACILVGLIITLLMTPQYTAVSTVEISRESDRVANIQGVEREATDADQEFYQTQYGLLTARTLAERVATALRLTDDPAFFEMFGYDEGDLPALKLSNGRYEAVGRASRQRLAGEILLDHLQIEPTRQSRLVDIQFASPDPELSARIANAWAENFIQTNLERKVQSTSYGRQVLQRQLGEYKERLDESQRRLVAYASNQQIINLPGQGERGAPERSIVADDLASLNSALSDATSDRIAAEARYRRGGASGASEEALRNTAINNLRQRLAELKAQYQELMVRFEPAYPAAVAIKTQMDDIAGSIAREEARVSGSIQAQYRQALERESALKKRVEELKGDYLDMRRRSIQYNIYEQEVETNRALYDGLLQRFNEIGIAAGIGVNNVSIVDPADVPEKPSSPRLVLNMLAALLAGLLVGAGAALGFEQLDEAIADPAELERRLGLPLLGSVPKVEGETPREALLDRKSSLVDSYLAIQTNLAFSTENGVPRSFSVTSTRPAEGKSTTALSLATIVARSGKRVILIDGDMRSPSVHHLGGVGHERGLSNFLAGDEAIDGLSFEMEDLGISAMSAGPIPPNAAELLTGKRLSTLLERLLAEYDHVIIDSPPVMGLADALLIASRVEGVIYAVESHGIRASQVQTAVSRLRTSGTKIFGGVLTKFRARKGSYGYGYEYGYDYGHEERRAEA